LSHRKSRLGACALTAVVACTLAVPAAAPAQGKSKAKSTPNTDVTVMSRNLYLGADLIKSATAPNRAALEQAATETLATVRQTNFPVRAKAIAQEIRATKPDLVGLQEVALWRKTADGVQTDAKDASIVVYDFLQILQQELRAAGQRYKVVVSQDEADFEVPTSQGFDIRLTMRDAILVRTGKQARVKAGKTYKGHYAQNFQITVPTTTITSLRGWVATDAKIRGRKFRFVNTHLEAYGGAIREAQAKQLVGSSGPLRSKKVPAILVGDLNSDPRDNTIDGAAYKAVTGAGFKNAFSSPPATSGQNETVDNTPSTLRAFIDHILFRPAMKVLDTEVVGDQESDKIQGLWPSDHAGVVAKLRVPAEKGKKKGHAKKGGKKKK
jgi:endonuclease/exonuclease/phosphatase family metal-dependent hydrolase